MPFLTTGERSFLQAVAKLGYCNPFLPERVEYEREVLGPDFEESEAIWSLRVDDPDTPRVNPLKIVARVEVLVGKLRKRLASGTSATERDLFLYEDAVLFLLFHRYQDHFYQAIVQEEKPQPPRKRFEFYQEFLHDWEYYFGLPTFPFPTREEAPHLFACFFQVRRAFHHIFRHIIGSSMIAARLRAAVWQSIFTHDMRRYRRSLYQRMGDFTTLITGPSGTGKELVARAIALSRYLPFHPDTLTFREDFTRLFYAINLSALPTTLVESELFGHRRGAFTGALQDKQGWLELCPPLGTVFLDEIGDLDPAVQVKLLRVLQTRQFQRLGETTAREFHGKLIAATNRNLYEAMQRGQFREDLYYRLCSDLIVTPSLYEQLRESPAVLGELLLFIAQRVVGPTEAERLAREAEAWIMTCLGPDYPWPGNIRELEQCVRNVLIRREYHPPERTPLSWKEELLQAFHSGSLTAEELLCRYCTLVYAQTRSYEETARRLQLDRRTVKRKIDPQLLARCRTASPAPQQRGAPGQP
ncbi:MAG: sigma-54-dependent Fis family transcriptional regulator [Nitrospinota bacterium]|nr:MAG: sigma-54-dependent Fis family transcriptional regulator [Nitrospinota bacterium]